MHLLLINTQSFGDILLSTHIARLAKYYIPNYKVHLVVRPYPELTLTTAENSRAAHSNMKALLSLQENIATVGDGQGMVIYPSHIQGRHVTEQELIDLELKSHNTKIILIQGWSSDLGIIKSQLKPFYDEFSIDSNNMDTETQFNVGVEKQLNSILTVGIAGDKDFLRKWHNEEEYKKFLELINSKKYNIKIEKFGVDISTDSYSEQLKRLNNCHLLISPMGSLIHAAAGLGVDTISLTSVFPSEYDCPEYYHSGWHRSVKGKPHCGNFACVGYKQYDGQRSWGNPTTEFSFWPKDCHYNSNGKSCNYNTTSQQLIEHFETWYNENSRIYGSKAA